MRGPFPRRVRLAQHASAKKRARQALVRRARNRQVRSTLRTSIKNVRGALSSGDAAAAATALREAERQIRRAASKGVLSKKQASRNVARLARAVHAASA